MRTILVVPVMALLVAAAPSPTVPIYREFGRWLVACDNVRSCLARGFDETTRAQLQLTRAAGQGPATLAFSAERPIVAGEMRMDGKPIALPLPAWSPADGAPATSDPVAIEAFIDAARAGHVITLDTGPPADDQARTIPLDGFNAALLLVDAVQGRVGAQTALIAAKGNAVAPPARQLPAAPHWVAPPPLTDVETRGLRQRARTLSSPTFDTCNVKEPPSVYPLDPTHALAIRPCYMAAYQGSSVVSVLPRSGGPGTPVTLALPGVPHDATDGPDMVDPVFDPATGTLSTTSKGRGLADCGSNESWTWVDGAFRLKAFDYQGLCGGTEPGDWPPLYRTR